MSYKVEELLALRDSVSESAVSIDKFADEDVIKEHVLRPSASATLAATSSNKSLRSSATPAVAPAAPNKKSSPSPSIKRGKAERLLKEHGSPPGMRVTAGGRVVPSDLPPLSNNRFINGTFKPLPFRDIVLDNAMPPQARPEPSNAHRLEVIGSQPILYVNNRPYALPALDTTNTNMPSLAVRGLSATPNPAAPSAAQPSVLSTRGSFASATSVPSRANTQTPFTGLDLPTLKAQQSLKKQELRGIEQTEVLEAAHQTEAWRAAIIEKKRNLIKELDLLRKQINSIEITDNNVAPTQSSGYVGVAGPTANPMPPSSFVPHFQQPMPTPMYGYPGAPTFPPMMMYPSAFGGFANMQAPEPASFAQHAVQAPQSPGSTGRRSHAIEIKPPREDVKQTFSTLDPKSPTYEPVAQATNNKEIAPPTPSLVKRSTWRADEVARPGNHEDRAVSHKPSLSSIDTTDFFPTNTHEHSSTRVAPKVQESKPGMNEDTVVPSTPEKHWPASPWNEGNSGRSSNKAVAKLTSWPEAFGKQPSIPSMKQAASIQERVPLPTAEAVKPIFSGMIGRRTAEQRTGTEENWQLLSSKPTHHVPSTYQEGYQAGYDHVGIPDSPEVLKGYIQGLLQFLADESMKGRNAPLRGLVAESTPHDSAVSMTFNRADVPLGSQENARFSKYNAAFDMRKDSAFSAQDDSIAYTLCNEAAQDSRIRNASPATCLAPAKAMDTSASTYGQAALSTTESDQNKKKQDKGTVSRADSALLGGYPRQYSGNQRSSHTFGNPIPMQRYHPVSKAYGQNKFNANVQFSTRPNTNQRLSGFDGAMDDLADLVLDTSIDDQRSTTEGQRSADAVGSSNAADADASCFRPSSSKGKQKLASSPSKSTPDERSERAVTSPVNVPGSPKKSGEHSPAKAKLEQVTNKFRRSRRSDPRHMSPEEKKQRSKKWHERFRQLKESERAEIQKHVEENPRH